MKQRLGAKQKLPLTLRDAISVIANATGTPAEQLSTACSDLLSPDDGAGLLSSFIVRIADNPSLLLALKSKSVRRLIEELLELATNNPVSGGLDVERERIYWVLESLGVAQVRRYPITTSRSNEQIDLFEMQRALPQGEAWLAASRRLLSSSYRGDALGADARLGILCIWVSLHCGVGYKYELIQTLRELRAGRIRASNGLYWTSTALEHRRDERRRQWLLPEIVLLASTIRWPDLRNFELDNHCIRDALIALKRTDRSAFQGLGVNRLLFMCKARAALLARLPMFMLGYISGDYFSSSLSERALARLMGMGPSAIDAEEVPKISEAIYDSPRNDAEQDTKANITELSQHPVLPSNPLTTLLRILNTKSANAKPEIRAYIASAMREITPEIGLIGQMLTWCDMQLQTNQPSTVRILLANLHSRLMPHLDDLEAITDVSSWSELVHDMTDGLSKRSKSLSSITSFAKFLSEQFGDEFETVGQTALSAVNAQVLTPEEVDQAADLLVLRLGGELGAIAGQMLRLAYGAGLRRTEVDGLLGADIQDGLISMLLVRENAYRRLKTTNAHRNVPLDITEDLFAGSLGLLHERAPADSGQLLFQCDLYAPLSDQSKRLFDAISQALQNVTGEPMAKFHSARHSFASNLFLLAHFDDFELARFEEALPYLRSIRPALETTRALVRNASSRGRFELANIRQMMGHLSETTTLMHYIHWCDLVRLAAFSKPGVRLELSPDECLGAMGRRQNSRAPGSKLEHAEPLAADLVMKICHPLTARVRTQSALASAQVVATASLEKAISQVMQMAHAYYEGKEILPLVIDEWGEITQSQVSDFISWVMRYYLGKPALSRHDERPFLEPRDKGFRLAYRQILANLEAIGPDGRRIASGELQWLFERACAPYMSFKIIGSEELSRVQALKEKILHGMDVVFEIRSSRDNNLSDRLIVDELAGLEHHEKHLFIKIMRRDGRFQHRALRWTAFAIILLAGNKLAPSSAHSA